MSSHPRQRRRTLWWVPFAALVIATTVMSLILSTGIYDQPDEARHPFLSIMFATVVLEFSFLVARLLAGGLLVVIALLLRGWPSRRRFVVVVVAAVGIGALLIWLVVPFIGWTQSGVHFSVLYLALVVSLLWLVESRSLRGVVPGE